jgi:hypothetical protein
VPEDDAQALIDTSTPHPARRYNYWLGGKDHFASDRESGDAVAAAFPTARLWARENRAFLRRAVEFLTREAGIRQFLDIGTGLPTADNTHEVAQRLAPESRVVYADNDPIVLTHARALLAGSPQGETAYLSADLRDPESILRSEEVARVLDLTRPVALMLIAVAHFIDEQEDPYALVRTLLSALPSGSYLVMTHATMDLSDPETATRVATVWEQTPPAARWHPRTRDQFAEFYSDLELVDPGIQIISEWRPDAGERPAPADVACFGAVARIP